MIEASYFWTIVVFLAMGTLAIRSSIIALSARVRIDDRIRQVFSFIPAAILPAFAAPAVFFHPGTVSWMMGKERLAILALAIALCYFTRSTLATISFGLVTLYLVSHAI